MEYPGSTIYYNNIYDNGGANGYDSAAGNEWDNGTHGNYWGNYKTRYPGAAAISGLYWSIPYETSPGGVFDHFPLVAQIFPGSMDVTWYCTWGGTQDEFGYSVWGDGTYIYSCGVTPSFGAGNDDLLLVKWDAAGNQVWNRTWGTTAIDRGFGVWGYGSAIYTAGLTNGRMLLVKWDTAGNQVWNRTSLVSPEDCAFSVSGDYLGNVYTTGYTKMSAFWDMVLVKWDSNGNQLWYKTWGDSSFHDHAESVWVDNAGVIYTCGVNFENKMVLVKWDAAGNEIWNHTWTGATSSHGYAITGDGIGHIYTCGSYSPYNDLIMVKWDAAGNQVWNRTWNGLAANQQLGIWADDASIFVCGSTDKYGAGGEMIVGKWDAVTGNRLWHRTWGGPASDQGRAIWSDGTSIYTCGHTSSFGAGLADITIVRWDKNVGAPQVQIASPSSGTCFRDRFTFQANVFDTDFANVTYRVEGLTEHLFTRNASTLLGSTDWDAIGQGMHTMTIVARDLASHSTTRYLTFIKDTVTPIISIPFPANGTVFNSTFSFRADVFDANFASITYQVDARAPHVFTRNVSTSLDSGDWASVGQGTHQIMIQAIDLAGNALQASITFVKDTVAPSTSMAYIPPSDPEFIIPTTSFNLTSGDVGGSGVAATFYRLNNTAWTPYTAPFSPSTFGNGTLLIQYYSIDNAGNAETIISLTVYIDTIPPNTTLSVTPFPPDFVNGTTIFTLAATDNAGGSGLWLTEYRINGGDWTSGTSFTIPANGTCTIDYRSMDNVYITEVYGTRVYRVDSITPNTTLSVLTFAPDFTNGTRSFTLSRADNTGGSGILRTEYRINGGGWITGTSFTIPANGTHVIDYRSIDNVNNVEAFGTRSIRVDSISPASTITFTPSQGLAYINKTTLLTMAAVDNTGGSGIAAQFYKIGASAWASYNAPFTLGAYPNGTYTILYYCVDNVGNVETTNLLTVHLDIEGPTITITSPGNQTYINSILGITIASSDPDFAAAWYSIAHSSNGTLVVSNRTWLPGAQETLADGRYWIRAWGNDTRGNIEQAALDVHFTVNTTVTITVLLLNPANTTYTNQFVLPLGYWTNATVSSVFYLLDNRWSIPGSNTTLDLHAFANESTFYDRFHVLQVVVVDTANQTYYSMPTWFTVVVANLTGAEVTIQLEGDPKGGNMYLVKMRVENTGTKSLRRLIIFASMLSETGYFIGGAVFSTGNSTIAPGGTRTFTFQIYVENPAEQVNLTLRIIAEGYNATIISLVVMPVNGFEITIVIILSAAGGAIVIVSVLGYKKKIPVLLKRGKRVVETGVDKQDASLRKRERLLLVADPEQPPVTKSEEKLDAIPAAGMDDDTMKKGAKKKQLAPAKKEVPAKELARYEREVKVDEKLDKCLVCKRDLVGDVYICPVCKVAKYHASCVQALIANGEPCWACKQSLAAGDGVVDVTAVRAEIRGIEETLTALKDQYEQHKLSKETFLKRSEQLMKEKAALDRKIVNYEDK
nr:hypothetical protein [Candidatus Sigynarchaeota archaeon]